MNAAPLVSGLFVEGAKSPVPEVKNTICNVGWSDCQNALNGAILHPNPIDVWLSHGSVGHCRLFFGARSPAFAMEMGTVTLHDSQDGVTATVPKWWINSVKVAQRYFLAKLAVEYDGKLPLVFMATPQSIYAEPMIRDIGDSQSRQNLLAAGYSESADQAAFDYMLGSFAAFKSTRLGLAFNPYQFVAPDGTGHQDVTYTCAFMDKFRARFGERAHIQNNSVRTPELGGQYPTMYDHMKGKKPLGFQTATSPRVGDYAKTLEWCIAQGAHSVELSPGFQNYLDSAALKKYDAALRANAA